MSALLFLDQREASLGLATHGSEAEIRNLIADWEDALCRRDLQSLMTFYSRDVVLFDVHPPFRVEGIERIRELWEDVLLLIPDRLERCDLRIEAAPAVALAHWCFRPAGPLDPSVIPAWIRVSAGYRRENGRWKIVHEHVSLPVDPITNQAVLLSELP
jgi:ketosteroid isomerase-like protein